MFYVSTALLIPKHLPALGLPGLDLEFEICPPPRLVPCIQEIDQSRGASARRKIFPFILGGWGMGGRDYPMEWWSGEVTDASSPSGDGAAGPQSWHWGASRTQDPKPPSTTVNVIPCAARLARSSPYLSTNLQTSVPLLLDLAGITREEGK